MSRGIPDWRASTAAGIGVLVGVLILSACGGGNSPGGSSGGKNGVVSDEHIVIGQSSSLSWLPVDIAVQDGYFKQVGLPNVTTSTIPSANNVAVAMATGDVQFGSVAIDRGILSTQKGKPTQCVANLQSTPPTSLVTSKSSGVPAGQWSALKGKTIGVSLGGWSQFMPEYLLKEHHIDPTSVHFTSTPSAPVMLTALKTGTVAAISGIEPAQTEAVQKGLGTNFFSLENASAIHQWWPSPFVADCLDAQTSYIQSHPAVVKAVFEAVVMGLQKIHQDPSEGVRVAKTVAPALDEATSRQTVTNLEATWSGDGKVSQAALGNLEKTLQGFHQLPMSLPPYKQLIYSGAAG